MGSAAMCRWGDSVAGGAGFEPDHTNTCVFATIPIGNNRP